MAKKNKSSSKDASDVSGDVTETEVISTEPQKEAAPVKTGAELLAEVKAKIACDYENKWRLNKGLKPFGRQPRFVKAEIEDLLAAMFNGDYSNAEKVMDKINSNPENSEFYGFYKSYGMVVAIAYLGDLVGLWNADIEGFCMTKNPEPNPGEILKKKEALDIIKAQIKELEDNIAVWEAEILADNMAHAKDMINARNEIKTKDKVFWQLREVLAAEVEAAKEVKPKYFQGSHMVYDVLIYHHVIAEIAERAKSMGMTNVAEAVNKWIGSKKFMDRKKDGISVHHEEE